MEGKRSSIQEGMVASSSSMISALPSSSLSSSFSVACQGAAVQGLGCLPRARGAPPRGQAAQTWRALQGCAAGGGGGGLATRMGGRSAPLPCAGGLVKPRRQGQKRHVVWAQAVSHAVEGGTRCGRNHPQAGEVL